MDITKTISNELASDVQNLLRHYLKRASTENKQSFISLVGSVLTGKAKDDPIIQHNIKKTGSNAALALSFASMGLAIGGTILEAMEPYSSGQSYTGLMITYGIGITSFCISEFLKTSDIENIEKFHPEIKNMLLDDNLSEILNDDAVTLKILETLSQNNPTKADEVKQLAWLHANSKEIRDSEAPIQHQYNKQTIKP